MFVNCEEVRLCGVLLFSSTSFFKAYSVCTEERSSCIAAGALLVTSLTITYFHMRMHTIIGAKSFHGPVRDGKGWYQLAMVIRHNL